MNNSTKCNSNAIRFTEIGTTRSVPAQIKQVIIFQTLIVYLVCGAAIWLAFRLVAGAIDRVKLKEFDRQVGGLFGAAKGVLWCVVITFFAVTMSPTARDMVLRSRSGYYIAVLIDRAEPVMPAEIRDVLHPYLDRLDHELAPTTAHNSAVAPPT